MISKIVKYFPVRRFLSTSTGTGTGKTNVVLLIDENGKSLGLQDPLKFTYDKSKYELNCVSSPDSSKEATYRLFPKGAAYRKAKEAHAAAVQARRTSRTKQVHFGCSMSEHDFRVHVERARGFLEEKGWRVQVVVEPSSNKEKAMKTTGVIGGFCSKIVEALTSVGAPEGAPAEHTQGMSFMLKPRKK